MDDPDWELSRPASRGEFRLLAESISECVWVLRADGRCEYVNPKFREHTGLSEEAALGSGWTRAVHPEDFGSFWSRWSALVRGEDATIEEDLRLRDAGGADRRYRVRVARLTGGRTREPSLWFATASALEAKAGGVTSPSAPVDEALRKAQAQLRTLVEASPAISYVMGPEGEPLYASSRWEEYFGITFEEAARRHWVGTIHPEDYPGVIERWAVSVASGEVFESEHRLPRRDGQLRWHLARTVPVPNGGDGHLLGWCGTLTDIHALKTTEEALRASEQRYRDLFSAIDDGFCILQMVFDSRDEPVDYVFVEMNAAFERHTGLADAAGKSARELVPELDESWFRIYGDVARTGEARRFENSSPAMDRCFDVFAFRVGAPEDRRVGLVFRDISEHRRAESIIRESEERFRALADNIAQLAWIANPNGSVAWVNKRWIEYAGRGHPEPIEHVDPSHRQRVREGFRRHLTSGEPWEDTIPLRRKDGTYRWFLSRMVPIRDGTGAVVRWCGTSTDITEQRRAQEALEEADRRKDEFLAVLAHELRNPLGPIRSAAQILRMLAPEQPALARAREVIDRQVAHMARLIDDLLDVSRIARGKVQLRMERCDLTQIVARTAEDYRTMLESGGLTLDVRAPAALWVHGDPTRLGQMLGNLLHNAAKFTDRGGRVEVRVRENLSTAQAVVEVRDTGAGMDAAMLGRLFEPFSQADRTLDRSRGGLGLGLALLKGLAALHGGSVQADSEGPGSGSTLAFCVPLAATPAARERPEAHRPPVGKLRVLVIEDNRDAAELLQLMLSLMGHEALVAFDGEAGVRVARSARPDVVFSDLGLPGAMDGYAVARALRADDSLATTCLVALSGYGQPEDRARALDAGFDRHLIKPADHDDLCQVLAMVDRG